MINCLTEVNEEIDDDMDGAIEVEDPLESEKVQVE